MTDPARTPFDAELAPTLEAVPAYFTTLRARLDRGVPGRDLAAAATRRARRRAAGERTDHVIAGHDGGEIVVSVFRRTDHDGRRRPGVYLLHGGGMVGGSRGRWHPCSSSGSSSTAQSAAAVDYRLAPEFPDPTPVEDYAAGYWFVGQAEELGFDPDTC